MWRTVERILSSGVVYFARKGEFDIVKQLIRDNIKQILINEVDKEGRTVLSYASEKGDLNLIKLSLALKADPLVCDKNGVSPLMYSAKNGNAECTAEICSNKIGKKGINFLDKEGWSALMYAARYGRRRDITILLKNGADRALKNKENLDARAVARMSGWAELSVYIKEYTTNKVYTNISKDALRK